MSTQKPKKKIRTRGIGKSVILADVRKALTATTLQDKLGLREIDLIVKLFVTAIRSRITHGERVALAGFGSFFISSRKGRLATLQGSKQIRIPPHQVVRFKAAGIVRDHINGRGLLRPVSIPGDFRVIIAPAKKRVKSKVKSRSK